MIRELGYQRSKPPPRIKLIQTIFIVVGILVLVIIGVFHTLPTTQILQTLKDKPLATFSASRAMAHVRHIGANPHPIGSVENTNVRQYVVDQLNALGLQPEIQSTLIVNPRKQQVGRIHNVLVKIPGSLPGKAVLLMAHYDSVPTGPGAADDGASVAAILETLRALKALPALQNDLWCLFTDGEEAGLLGAEAFVQQQPLIKNIGLTLNFEYRGNSGAFMMFEASQGNSNLIKGLAASAPHILANSLMYEVYKFLPNDTDFTVFKQAGIPWMNFAAIEGHTNYHTQLDRPVFLDQNTLQEQGDTLLALIKYFGNNPLNNLQTTDHVYFDIPGLGLVNYPASWVMPLNGCLLILFTLVFKLALKTQSVRITQVILGGFVFILLLLSLPVISHFLWLGICRIHPKYDTFIQGDIYNSQWYLLAFVFLNIGLFVFSQGWVCRKMSAIEFSFGVIACWFCILLLTSFWVLGASFLFLWPLLGMLVVLGVPFVRTLNNHQPSNLALIFVGSMPAIIIFTPLIRCLFIGLTPRLTAVVIVFLVLLLGLLTPLFEAMEKRKYLAKSCLLLGLIALLAGSMTSGFDNEHPQQNTLFYALNTSNHSAFWLTTDKQIDQWTTNFFPNAQAKQQLPELFGKPFPALWVSPAPVLDLPAPTVETLADTIIAGHRNIKLKIKSVRHAPKLKVSIEATEILNSKIAGQKFTKYPQTHWYLDSFGFNDEGLIIEFMVAADTHFAVKVMDISYELPTFTLPRPSNMISKPSEFSDNTIVATSKNW